MQHSASRINALRFAGNASPLVSHRARKCPTQLPDGHNAANAFNLLSAPIERRTPHSFFYYVLALSLSTGRGDTRRVERISLKKRLNREM